MPIHALSGYCAQASILMHCWQRRPHGGSQPSHPCLFSLQCHVSLVYFRLMPMHLCCCCKLVPTSCCATATNSCPHLAVLLPQTRALLQLCFKSPAIYRYPLCFNPLRRFHAQQQLRLGTCSAHLTQHTPCKSIKPSKMLLKSEGQCSRRDAFVHLYKNFLGFLR